MRNGSSEKTQDPFRWFDSSPKVIRLVVMMYVRYPLSLRNVEDLLFERGIDICHETVRFWWNRFGPMFAAEICKKRVDRIQPKRLARWWLNRPTANAKNLHRPMPSRETLENALTWREERTVSQALTLQYDKVLFILHPTEEAQEAIACEGTVKATK